MKKKNFCVAVNYEQKFLPTTRHRKVRNTMRTINTTVTIKQPETPDEFPVAMVVSNHETRGGKFGLYDNTLRTLDGKLYSKDRYPGKGSGMSMTTKDVLSDISGNRTYRVYGSCDEFTDKSVPVSSDLNKRLEDVEERASDFVLYKGEYWRACGEPMYVVMTFGLGHNHGGTSVMLDYGYNPNIAAYWYFNANERDAAIRCALDTAKRRGDTDDLDRIKNLDKNIKVLLPETVNRNPAADHGDGNEFINTAEEMIENSSGAFEAGLSVIALSMIHG